MTIKSARTNISTNQKYIEPWVKNPPIALGLKVEKKFGQKWHGGSIISYDIDMDTNETLWHIKYDDGDEEDCSARELSTMICEDFDAEC